MNSENLKVHEVTLNKEQILNAVAMHIESLPFFRGEVIELEIEGLYKTPGIPVKFKLKEVE